MPFFARTLTSLNVLKPLMFATLWSIVLSSASFAQETSRGLEGIVRDETGGVIAGGTVIIRQDSSSFERLLETGRDGRFTASQLVNGEYHIEVIAPGFAVFSTSARVPVSQPL